MQLIGFAVLMLLTAAAGYERRPAPSNAPSQEAGIGDHVEPSRWNTTPPPPAAGE